MYYAATNTLTPTPFGFSLANDVEYAKVSFDYAPGFRLGLTYMFPKSDWNLSLSWTHFETSGSDSVDATPERIISTFWEQVGAVTASTANSVLNVNFENVDLELGKTINLFKCFVFHTYFGASYYKLNLNENINYIGIFDPTDDPATATAFLQDHSQGWGLNIGADSIWKLGNGFGIYGLGEYSIYYSPCDNTITQNTSVPAQLIDLTITSQNNYTTFHQIFRIGCGLSWHHTFNVKTNPIKLALMIGYEINYLPQQVELNRPQFNGTENTLIPIPTNGNVGFQGLTVGAALTY